MYLREQYEPLLTFDAYQPMLDAQSTSHFLTHEFIFIFCFIELTEPEEVVATTKKVLLGVPQENRRILQRLFHLLVAIVANCEQNKVLQQQAKK